jgi:hypothetical protein
MSHIKTVGDGEKLLTYLNSALKVLLGLDIFPRIKKKSKILLSSVINTQLEYFNVTYASKI